MPTIDPAVAKEWPLLALFVAFVMAGGGLAYKFATLFIAFWKDREKAVADMLANLTKAQDERWQTFIAKEGELNRAFIKEICDQNKAGDDLMAQRLQELAELFDRFLSRFETHDSRTVAIARAVRAGDVKKGQL